MRILRMVLVAALIAGCSDSNAPASINGRYPLRTYRYQPLPGMVSETANQTIRITGGSITLNGDLTFEISYSFEEYYYGRFSTRDVHCIGYWQPTETSPQGGQMITLTETSTPGCGDRATAEWDHHDRLTIVWAMLGDTQHRR